KREQKDGMQDDESKRVMRWFWRVEECSAPLSVVKGCHLGHERAAARRRCTGRRGALPTCVRFTENSKKGFAGRRPANSFRQLPIGGRVRRGCVRKRPFFDATGVHP